MNIDLILTCITALSSILVAAITYYQSKKVVFFQNLFNRKADAYEKFLHAIAALPTNENELYKHCSLARIVLLYCFDEHRNIITDYLDLIISTYQIDKETERWDDAVCKLREKRKEVVLILRTEMQNCKDGKYY